MNDYYAYQALRSAGLLNELEERLPDKEYRSKHYAPYLCRRADLNRKEVYVKEWERLADTSKAQFQCLDAVTEMSGRVTSLWSGKLPNGTELFIISVDRPAENPRYDRGSIDRDEAWSFFGRFKKAMAA